MKTIEDLPDRSFFISLNVESDEQPVFFKENEHLIFNIETGQKPGLDDEIHVILLRFGNFIPDILEKCVGFLLSKR